MKKIILFFFLSLCVIITGAQTSEINSIRQSLQNTNDDSTRVLLLEKLSFAFLRSRPDSALVLAEEGLILSKEIDFEKGEAICLNRIGTVLRSTGNYLQALEALLNALKINEKINNKDGRMRNLGNIGNVYANQGDYREALNYSFQEKTIAEAVADKDRLVTTLLSMGDTYEKIDILDSARTYTHQAYELALKMKNDYYTGTALNNLGNIYSKMDLTAAAMEFYKLSLMYYEREEEPDDEGICETTLGIARLFQNKGNFDSALYYAKRSAVTAKTSGFPKYLLEASQFLTNYYKNKNNIDSAFVYQAIIIAANDTLYNQEKTKQLNSLSFNEKIRQQQLEAEKIKKEQERKNNIQLMGIATAIISVFLFFLLLRRKKTGARTAEVFGIILLLMLFEFISLLIHPWIERITHHTPVFMMLILVSIAAVLVPLHHYLEKLIKEKIKMRPAARRGA